MAISAVNSISMVSFGYKHKLKTLWKAGELPSVVKGLYGDVLTSDTVTLEHCMAHSKGGKTILGNLALASKATNNARGNADITKFLTPKMATDYLEQFTGIKIKGFNGDAYKEALKNTLIKLGVKF